MSSSSASAPVEIGHVALTVNDLEGVGRFYETTLGLEPLARDGGTARYGAGGKVLTLQARHSLRGGAKSRGSLQLEWAYPLAGQLFGYVQLFSGYGDSLIDYNFRQTRLGVGVSLVEWL